MSYDAEGNIWKDPEHDGPPTVPLFCQCGWQGDAPIRQTHPGLRETHESPAEPPAFVITCLGCGEEFNPDDIEPAHCEQCGELTTPTSAHAYALLCDTCAMETLREDPGICGRPLYLDHQLAAVCIVPYGTEHTH